MKSEQKVYWPETTIFWGAGATASLGMSQTAQLGRLIRKLANKEPITKERFEDYFGENTQKVIDLLVVLGNELASNLFTVSKEESEAAQRLFCSLKEEQQKEHIVSLRETYDWDALKRIIGITPDCETPGNFLRDLFNIIDMHSRSGQGFYVEKDSSEEPYHIPCNRLIPARNCLIMLVNLSFYFSYQTLLKQPGKLEPYIKFCMALSRAMQKEGFDRIGMSLKEREFYLFSYAVVSMNFDPLFLWLIFNAHRELNENPPYIGHPPQPMKLFHDFGIFMGVRAIGKIDWKIWYPFNETVVQRINDEKYASGRRARIGKFYFPHGCSCWRECRNCGKLTAHFGDEWDFYSRSLFPNPLIPEIGYAEPRTAKEEKASDSRPDLIQCAYCGTPTYTCDTPMIMQTSFKGDQPHYLEDIQRDLRVCLENTRHVVLMGYSLPPDDVIWRSTLAARKSRNRKEPVKCSVIVGFKGPKEWLSGEELRKYLKKNSDFGQEHRSEHGIDAIISAKEIFGLENIRAWTHGIPQVWQNKADIDENIKAIMNWC